MKKLILVAAFALPALCVACSKDDPTETPAVPDAAATAASPAEEAATDQEADELAKEIEADLAEES